MAGQFRLGQWVITQRYLKGDLSAERKRRLDRIGFVWNCVEHRWEKSFAALLKFKRREGHCRVPISHSEGKCRLGWWVSTQRQRRQKLSRERKARLNKMVLCGKRIWVVGLVGVIGLTKRTTTAAEAA